MAKLRTHRVRFEPEGREVEVSQWTPLVRAAALAGLPIEMPCGGMGLCGKCRVTLLEGAQRPTGEERAHISPEDLERGVRLACRQSVDRPMVVSLAEALAHASNQIMVGGRAHDAELRPDARLVNINLPPAPMADHRADWRRVCEAVGEDLRPTLAALRDLGEQLAAEQTSLAVVAVGDEAIAVRPGPVAEPPLGVAVDIGTTTVVAYLLDLTTGIELAHAAGLNPQVVLGDDVVTRIQASVATPEGLPRLRDEVRGALDGLIRDACAQVERDPADVLRLTVVGNATMAHLFLGLSPRGLGLAPFAPLLQRALTVEGAEVGLTACPRARVTMLPNIGGFLGSDTVGAMLAVGHEPNGPTLIVDIGTNGEMVLWHDGQWLGCSAAAGPAFEGARISCGLRGSAGAISRVDWTNGEPQFTTIEDHPPRGLCGSGLLDLVAVLVRAGVIDMTGRLEEVGSDGAALNARLSGEGREARWRLATAAESATGQELSLTARDVREVQLAKGSLRASIESLLARAGLTADQLDAVYLAGGFGNYLRIESAQAIGLLPQMPLERIEAVGNAAGGGAKLALLSSEEMERAARLAAEVEVVDLATNPIYQEQLIEQMMFPEPE